MWVDLVLMGDGVPERRIEPGCLKAEGFKVDAGTAVQGGCGLERPHELGAQAGALALWRDPKLLDLTAGAPPAANGAPHDLTLLVSGKA